MLHLLAAAAAILLGVVLRLWNRRGGKFVGQDTWDYLLEARAIRENGGKIPEKIKSYAVDSPYDTPPLFFLLIERVLPEKNSYYWGKWLSVAFDAANAALIAAFVWLASGNADAAVLAAAFFAFTPSSTAESLTFNSRPFAAFLFTCFAILATVYAAACAWWLLLAAALGFFVIMMTHKMTTQAAIVASVGLVVATRNPAFLFPLAGGFLLAFVFAGSYYAKVLRGHLAVLSFWRKNIDKRRKMSFARFAAFSLSKLLFNPWIVFSFIFVAQTPLQSALQAISLSLFAAALLTSFKPFAFLGENQRYLEYSSLSSFALASVFIVRNPTPLVFTVAASSVAVSVAVLAAYQRQLNQIPENTQSSEFLDAARAVKRSKRDVVLSVPDYSASIAFFTGKRVLAASSPTAWAAHPWLVFREEMDVERAARDYGVGLVLVSREFDEAKLNKTRKKKTRKKNWRVAFENKSFVLYETGLGANAAAGSKRKTRRERASRRNSRK